MIGAGGGEGRRETTQMAHAREELLGDILKDE